MSLAEPTTLSTCAREPIHVPGAIQPHGILVAFEPESGAVRQISANAAEVFGREPQTLLGQSAYTLLPTAERALRAALSRQATTPLFVQLNGQAWEAVLHHSGGLAVLELEAQEQETGHHLLEEQYALSQIIQQLQDTHSVQALCEATCAAVAAITQFDRVMVYKFDVDWHGEVIAETKAPELDPYLGLHYPAEDIPAQARKLYEHNWLRLIAAVDYQPVPLLSADPAPLDLSQSTLRSVSPIHLEYLRNMGVGCSMSVSLLHEGKLWGLIACHHRTAKRIPFARRAACQLVGQICSSQIGARELASLQAARLRAREIQRSFYEHLANSDRFEDALLRYMPEVLTVLDAQGAAIVVNDRVELVGTTPPAETVQAMVRWIRRDVPDAVYTTRSLMLANPEFASCMDVASGLMAAALSALRTDYVLWFRPEVITTVTWAGNPHKAVEEDQHTLHPRKSFAAWKETVRGESIAWEEYQREAAQELVAAINASMFRRYDSLRHLNTDLERKNSDLDSFAHIASHDLQEPLRGIRSQAIYMLEDYQAILPEEGTQRLQKVQLLTERLQEQLAALLQFSRVGRKAMNLRTVDAGRIVQETVEMISDRIKAAGAQVTVQPDLPSAVAEPSLLREVFANFITNALKYNDSPQKQVLIGSEPCETEDEVIFFVRDNGIGIEESLQEEVFRIFRRLHLREEYGGGAGAGLSIVKSIVERHGGRVWLRSAPGQGTTFYFSLPRSDEHVTVAAASGFNS